MPFHSFDHHYRPVAPTLAQRLEERSQFITESGCQIWMGRLDSTGYGQLFADGKYQRTSRLSWTIYCGSIPDGMCVLHSCDIPCCINPNHLFLGTRKENTADMVRKGRAVFFGRRIAGRAA